MFKRHLKSLGDNVKPKIYDTLHVLGSQNENKCASVVGGKESLYCMPDLPSQSTPQGISRNLSIKNADSNPGDDKLSPMLQSWV